VVAIGVFRENKGRSWRRAAYIAALRYLLGNTPNALGLKFAVGVTTADLYAKWARESGAEVLTDELPEGAMLHWIGSRREDRVILYLHGTYYVPLTHLGEMMLIGEGRLVGCSGGGYVIPAAIECVSMLESLHKEYKGAVGIAMLNYCGSSCNT